MKFLNQLCNFSFLRKTLFHEVRYVYCKIIAMTKTVAVRGVCSHQRYFDFRVKCLWLILYLMHQYQKAVYLGCTANGYSV